MTKRWCYSCKKMCNFDHFVEYSSTNGKTWLKCGLRLSKFKNKRKKDFDNLKLSDRPTISGKYEINSLDYKKEIFLVKKYGITLDTYNKMYTEQNGKCAICDDYVENLFVDHSHSKGQVRGLLCVNCNFALGQFKENKELILNAINYLNKYTDVV